MTEPAPTQPATTHAVDDVTIAPARPGPSTDPVTPPTDPTPGDDAPGDTPPGADASERDKRRWAELTGRVGRRERERDEALARVESLQWREVERLAAASLAVPADIRIETSHLADLLDPDSGDVDPARVAAVVEALTTARPGLRRQQQPTPLPGAHGTAPAASPPTLADAMQRIARNRA